MILSSAEDITEIISILNEQQKIFNITAPICTEASHPIFLGHLLTNNNGNNNLQTHHFEEEGYFYKNAYALKLCEYYEPAHIDDIQREKDILDIFRDDPRIIQYEMKIEVTYKGLKHILLATKYFQKSDLFNFIWDVLFPDNITENFLKVVAYNSLDILSLLKKRKVVHNDFKFENMMVEFNPTFNIVLIDFESSQMLENNEYSNFFGGSFLYESPEALQQKPHSYPSDMWSLGVCLFLSFCQVYPFDLNDQTDDTRIKVYRKIMTKKLVNYDNMIPDDAWEFISRALVINPEQRITPEEAMKLKWFDNEINDVKKAANSIVPDVEDSESQNDLYEFF